MRGPFSPLGAEVTVWMDAPPAKVWDLVSDVTRIGEFSPETFEAKWTRGSTGPEVGAQFAGHVRRNGVGPTYWSPCQVTACEAEEVFEFSVGSTTQRIASCEVDIDWGNPLFVAVGVALGEWIALPLT